ncbi:MAG TPA: F0F1 ATP synthase subunit A [Longimicrobiales bacterium]
MIGHVLGLVAAAAEKTPSLGDMIMEHVADSHEWEAPWGIVHLPRWQPIHIGGLSIDMSPTKHVVMMLVGAVLLCVIMIWTAQRKHAPRAAERAPSGFANMMEAFVIFLRDEVAMANIGHGGEKYVPYVLTLFFFILFSNLLGLLPFGATATGNLSVTATLAVISLAIIEISGFITLGPKGYARTIFYAPEGMGPVGRALMLIVMTPVELIGKFTKPFALCMRLFANMNGGHFVILSLIGLTVTAGTIKYTGIFLAPVVMAVAIMVLELFVAVLQAYIFAMLTSVFIGLIRHAH